MLALLPELSASWIDVLFSVDLKPVSQCHSDLLAKFSHDPSTSCFYLLWIIDVLENKVLEEASDPEMEEWSILILDPGNTRGHLSLYKQALHMYSVVK